MEPFHLRFTLTRRQRVSELFPWLPAIAGSIGFSIGGAFLATVVSPWFLFLLCLPLIYYPSLFALLLELTFRPTKSVEIAVNGDSLTMLIAGKRRVLPLEGIIQVFRTEGEASWTLLHADGSVILIPSAAITSEQVDYLKSFALRAAAARRAVD